MASKWTFFKYSAFLSRAGLTTFSRNSVTCSGARPTKALGLTMLSSLSATAAKRGSALMRYTNQRKKNSTYLQKIKRLAFLLVHASGLHGVDTNGLVELLSVASSLDALHEDVLGGHEWQLLLDVSLDDLLMNPPRNSTYLGPDNKTGSDVLDNSEDDIRREESLR